MSCPGKTAVRTHDVLSALRHTCNVSFQNRWLSSGMKTSALHIDEIAVHIAEACNVTNGAMAGQQLNPESEF